MEVLILLTLLIALDLAAWRWGHDSRDRHDWGLEQLTAGPGSGMGGRVMVSALMARGERPDPVA
jgi:hypothetical protein